VREWQGHVCASRESSFDVVRQYRLDISSGTYLVENDRILKYTRLLDDTGL
jgi:hypothetical protein